MTRTRPLATALALLVALVSTSRPGAAAQGFLSRIGRLLGRPVGSFVEAVTSPTLENVEGGGHRLIADVDTRLSGQIDQLGKQAKERIEQVDAVAQDRLAQADSIMAARIVQVDASANRLVEKSLGEVDEISRKRIEQAAQAGGALIKQVDGAAQARLDQADRILQERIEQGPKLWEDLFADVREEMEAGTDPSHPRARALAQRWLELIMEFTGGDPGVFQSLRRMYASEENVGGVDVQAMRPVNEYIQKAADAAGIKHPGA